MTNKTVTEVSVNQNFIENKILTIRGQHVMLDSDLAEIYQVETKVLNQAVKRNIERFPENFRFQLTHYEKNELVTNCDRLESIKHSTVNPYAFTEQGVAMLSAVLRSKIAITVSVQIINTFVQMRKLVGQNAVQQMHLDNIKSKLIEHDIKIKVKSFLEVL